MTCPICDNWNKTPHSKRFTTPIPPQYVEEGIAIGYWAGISQPSDTDPLKELCDKHRGVVTALQKQNQFKKRTAPTLPPPVRIPISQAIAAAQGTTGTAPPVAPTIPRNTTLPTPPSEEGLRKSFLAIAQECAAEYTKQHPASAQAQAIATRVAQAKAQAYDPSLNPEEEEKQLITQVPAGILLQALMSIAQHSTDPDVAQFAARVLDGTALPPPPLPPPSYVNPDLLSDPPATVAGALAAGNPITFPCPLCNKNVKPGEVHSC